MSPATFTFIAPPDVTALLTARSDPAPVVVIAVVKEFHGPITLTSPALVSAALEALRPVTVRAPLLFKVRLPALAVPLNADSSFGPVSSVLPLVVVLKDPAMIRPC